MIHHLIVGLKFLPDIWPFMISGCDVQRRPATVQSAGTALQTSVCCDGLALGLLTGRPPSAVRWRHKYQNLLADRLTS